MSNLDHQAFWMPFSSNQAFKENPRMLVSAKDMHYITDNGQNLLDATSGLWCVNAGHCRPKIVEAIQRQANLMDYSPAFQMGHKDAFTLANRITNLAPGNLNHAFFCNSGSEGVDTSLKIALAYHRATGESSRTVFIGRERGYHGAGFGGISVGGITTNRKAFGSMLPRVDHLPDTHNIQHNSFSRGQPKWGAELADELEKRIISLHDASNIAAVIVEPLAGSTGVLVPPIGYLEKLRQICDKYKLLLIFDEVITGFGRTGPCFAADAVGVVPDMMIIAKGLTNGAVPMGAVLTRQDIYETIVNNSTPDTIEFFHGYTYSGHPLATAAALATLDTYEEEGLFTRSQEMSPYFEEAIHSLREFPNVIDIRNMGMVAGIELEPKVSSNTTLAYKAFLKCYDKGLLIRTTGNTIALSPPLIITKSQIDEIVEILGSALIEIDQ
jgi:beta-alanine--pyruvate transaminase